MLAQKADFHKKAAKSIAVFIENKTHNKIGRSYWFVMVIFKLLFFEAGAGWDELADNYIFFQPF